MKIEGPGKTSGTKGVSKSDAKKGASGSEFSGLIDETPASAAASPTGATVSIGSLEALLTLQEAGDGTSEEARKRAKQRGQMLLDQLDRVRIGLLTGGIPKSALQQIAQTVTAHRDNIMDPVLREIMDEIELRAQVELAKYG